MLKQLYIKNFTLIDELNIQMHPGFSVITGETGAGKSIILGAIGLLLGNRADSKSIKAGRDRCVIEGRDPELVENPYASTRAEDKAFRPSSPETIEAPAKKVHMIPQKIESPEEPAQEGQPENPVSDPSPSGGDAPQESGSTPSEPPKDTP